MVGTVGGAAAILEQQAFEASVVGLAHRRMDADVGRDARQHEVGNAAQPQHQFEIGGAEGAFAGLVDDRLAGQWGQLRYDLPPGLAAHQDSAARAGVANAGADAPRAPALIRRKVGEVGTMSLAGVKDMEALAAHYGEHSCDRLDRRTGKAQIASHAVDIAADAAEIGLHVDDDQRRVRRPKIAVIGPGIRIGRDIALGHGSARAEVRISIRSNIMPMTSCSLKIATLRYAFLSGEISVATLVDQLLT